MPLVKIGWMANNRERDDEASLHGMFFEELPDYLAGVELTGCLANHPFGQVL